MLREKESDYFFYRPVYKDVYSPDIDWYIVVSYFTDNLLQPHICRFLSVEMLTRAVDRIEASFFEEIYEFD